MTADPVYVLAVKADVGWMLGTFTAVREYPADTPVARLRSAVVVQQVGWWCNVHDGLATHQGTCTKSCLCTPVYAEVKDQ